MKLKTLIGMFALTGAMVGFSATDAELKAMLEANDYTGFAAKKSYQCYKY